MPHAITSGEFNDRFATTRWSVVLGAGGQISRVDARRALADLCETYWPPLYAYLRRNGSSTADAEDTTRPRPLSFFSAGVYALALLGGILLFQASIFLTIRSLMRRAARQEAEQDG